MKYSEAVRKSKKREAFRRNAQGLKVFGDESGMLHVKALNGNTRQICIKVNYDPETGKRSISKEDDTSGDDWEIMN